MGGAGARVANLTAKAKKIGTAVVVLVLSTFDDAMFDVRRFMLYARLCFIAVFLWPWWLGLVACCFGRAFYWAELGCL